MYSARDGLPPAVEVAADVPHDAASTMKVAVLCALRRSALDLDVPVRVGNDFASAVPGERYANDPAMDSDPAPWRMIGATASLRWLAERMIVHSSNLATNVCIEHVGLDAVADVWRLAGARHSATPRGIEDYVADRQGIHNVVTAADLARLLTWMPEPWLAALEANVHRVDLAAGLPGGTRIAFKNGWFDRVRHSAGVVYPAGEPRYVIAVCYSGALANGADADDPAAPLVARISADVWERRNRLDSDRAPWPDWTALARDLADERPA